MSKKGGGGGEAAQARSDEQARQEKIRAGTTRINDIFNGSTKAIGQLGSDAGYDPAKTYYTAEGKAWTPSMAATPAGSWTTQSVFSGGGEGGGGSDAVWTPGTAPTTETAFRDALKGGLYTGTQTEGGFNDDFFNNRRQAFIDYANPQLEDQYSTAQKSLTYQLARQGLLDSSVRADKGAELQKQYDLNKQQVADQALSYATEARNNVEKARSDLITTLNATGDADGAANSAIARASALSAPQAFSPLTQLFSDFTSGLATQAGYERANALGGTGAGQPQIGRYNTGLFSSEKSVSVNNK